MATLQDFTPVDNIPALVKEDRTEGTGRYGNLPLHGCGCQDRRGVSELA
jgi:hypothetical protein